MGKRSPNWSIEENTLALSLYAVTAYSQISPRNPQIIALAKLIGRRPGAVSYKLGNFASLDNKAKGKGLKNMANRNGAS